MNNVLKMDHVDMTPVDVAISRCVQNMIATYGENKVKATMKELFGIEIQRTIPLTKKDQIDKIVLSKSKDHCVIHMVNGTTLFFNFFKLGMTYIEGIEWLHGVFNGPAMDKHAA